MNKRCYKLRFCHVRQMLIPVAEFVKRASKPSPGINIDSTDNEYIRSFFSSLSNSISQIALFTSSQARCFPNVKQLAATLPLAMLAIWPQPGFAQEASGGLPPEDKSTVTALPLNPAPPLVSKIPDPELIHIMTPDVKGISHNTKKVFNVEPSGVIFNNSLVSGTRSYLFNGQLMANPNLKGKAADVILMEVTGYEPTYIKGRMEINGQKADLLIANPKGITLNGDITTINTNSLTLTTGVFQRLKDGFEFAVSEGKITLKGNMDTRFVKSVGNLRAVQQDALTNFDIVALSVEIIGNIGMGSAEGLADEKTDLNIIAGPNNFAFPSREITKSRAPEETNEEKNHDTASEQNKEKKPNRGIAAFGTMYGRNITMVSTGSGAGVLHAGSILSADDIVISATDGGSVDLDNIMAPGKVALSGHNVSLGVNRSEEIKEIKVTKVNRDADLANQKKAEAGKKEDKNSAPEQAERDKTLADKKKAEGSNTQDKNSAPEKKEIPDLLVIKPGAVSVYIHRELSVQAKNAITLLGDQHVEGIAAFEAPTIILEPESGLRAGSAFLKAEDLHLGWLGYLSSRIKLEGDLSNISNRGRLVSGDKINLNVSNKLENYKGAGIYGVQELSMTSGGDVTNHGLISSLATINMSVGGFLSNMSTGTILTDALHIKASRLDNHGTIFGVNSAKIDITGHQLNLYSGSKTSSNQGNLEITSGLISTAEESIIAAQKINLKAGQIELQGKIAGSEITIDTDSFFQQSPAKTYAEDILHITARSYVNTSGEKELRSKKRAYLNLKNNLYIEDGIAFPWSGELLSIKAHNIEVNSRKGFFNAGNVLLESEGDLTNNTLVASMNNIYLKSGGTLFNKENSSFWAQGHLAWTGKTFENQFNSSIEAGGDIAMEGGALHNRSGGSILANRHIILNVLEIRNEALETGSSSTRRHDRDHAEKRTSINAVRDNVAGVYVVRPYLDLPPMNFEKGLIQAGQNIFINQDPPEDETSSPEKKAETTSQEQKAKVEKIDFLNKATLFNAGTLSAGGQIRFKGSLYNQSVLPLVSVKEVLRKTHDMGQFHLSAETAIAVSSFKENFNNMLFFLDFLFRHEGQAVTMAPGFNASKEEFVNVIKDTKFGSNSLKLALSAIFGPEWRTQTYKELIRRWNEVYVKNYLGLDDLYIQNIGDESSKASISAAGSIFIEGKIVQQGWEKIQKNKPQEIVIGTEAGHNSEESIRPVVPGDKGNPVFHTGVDEHLPPPSSWDEKLSKQIQAILARKEFIEATDAEIIDIKNEEPKTEIKEKSGGVITHEKQSVDSSSDKSDDTPPKQDAASSEDKDTGASKTDDELLKKISGKVRPLFKTKNIFVDRSQILGLPLFYKYFNPEKIVSSTGEADDTPPRQETAEESSQAQDTAIESPKEFSILGSGYLEKVLIDKQLEELTRGRYSRLIEYKEEDTDQEGADQEGKKKGTAQEFIYKTLIENALITQSEMDKPLSEAEQVLADSNLKLSVKIGQPFTEKQQDLLERDIVWYVAMNYSAVTKKVTPQSKEGEAPPSGSTTIMVPVVYLGKETKARLKEEDSNAQNIIGSGQLLSISASKDGEIASYNGMFIGKDVVLNSDTDVTLIDGAGRLSGVRAEIGVHILANRDIIHEGGLVAGRNVRMFAGKNLRIATQLVFDKDGYSEANNLDYRDNAGKTHKVRAGSVLANKDKEDVDLGRLIQDIYNNIESKGGVVGGVYDVSEKHRSPRKRFKEIWFYNKNRVQDIRWEPIPAPPGVTNEVDRFYMLYNLMEMEDSFAKSFGYAELRNASDFRFEEIKALAKDKLDEIALYWKAIDTVENMDYIDGEKGTRAAQEVIENLLALIEYKKIALAPFITMVKEIKEGNRQKVKEIIKPLIDSTIANNIDPKHEGGILFNNAINSLKNIKALAEKNSEREGGGGESALESLRTLAEIKDKEGFLSSNAQKMIRNLSSIWSMKDMKAEDGSLLANIINTIQDLDDLSNMERSESPRTYEVIIHLKELKKLIEIAQGASSKIIDKAGASLQDISSEASPRKEKITQAMQLIEEWKKEGKSYIDKIRGIEESLNQRGTEDEASSSKLIEDLKSRDILDIEGLIAELEDLKTTSEDEKINQDLDAAIAGLQMMQIEEDARAETINTLLANLATLTTLDSPEQKAAKLSQMIASLEDLIKIKGMETLASMKSTLLTKLKKEKFIIKKEDIRASIKYLNSLEKNPEETEIATSRATLLKTMEKLEDLQLSLDKNRNEILVQLTELDNLNINKTGDTDKNTKEMLFYEKAIANIKNPVDFTPQQMITALEDLYKQDKKDKAEKDKIRSLIESLQSSLNMHSERNNLFREANSSVFMSNLEGPNTNPSKTFDLKNLLSLGTLFETANKEAKVKLNQALEEIQNIKEIQEKKIRTQNELIKIGNTTNINNLTEEEEARGLVKYMDIALEAVNQDWLKRMIKVLRHVKSERIKRYIREANTIDGVYELINSYDSLKLKPLLNKIRKSPALNNLRATLINIGPEIHGGGAASLNPDFMAQLSAMHYLPWGKSFLEILKPLANKNITENELNKLIEDLKRVDVYEINPTLRGLDIVGKIQTIIEASGLSKTATAKVIKLMEALDHSIKTSLKKTVQPLEEYIAGKHESVEDKVDQISKIVAALNQTLSIKEYELANKEEKAVKINRVINTLNSKIAKNEDDIIKLSNVFQALKRNISTNTTNLNELHEIDRKKALEDLKNSNEETVLLLKSLEEVLASNALDDKEEKTKEIINRLEDLKSAKNEKILVERNIIKNLRREHADDAKLKNILDNMEQISEIEEKEHLALLETLTRLKITNPIENPELKKAILYQSTLYEALEINNKNIYEKINKVLDLLNIIRDPELEAIQAEFQDLSNAEKIEDNTFQEAIKKKVGSWTETVNTKEMGGQELYDFLVKENNSFCSHRGARDYKECATAIYKLRDLKNGWAQRFEKNFNKLKEIVERKREEQIVAVSSPEKSKLIALSLKDFQNPEIRDAVKYLESLSNLKLKEEFSTVGKLLNFSPSDDDTVQRLISHLEKIANSLPDVLSSILGDLRKSLGERAGNSSLNISQEKVEKLKNQLNMSQEMLEGFDNQKDIDTFVDSLIVLREEKKNSTPYTQI